MFVQQQDSSSQPLVVVTRVLLAQKNSDEEMLMISVVFAMHKFSCGFNHFWACLILITVVGVINPRLD